MADRPSDVTEAKIAEWRRRLGPIPEESRKYMGSAHAAAAEEVGLANCWLQEKFTALGVSAEAWRGTCFAHGQISFGRDPWRVAQQIYDDFLKGKKYEPGKELAAAIVKGELSEHFGPGGEVRTKEEALKALGVTSVRELFDRFGVSAPEELRELLRKRLEEKEPR